MNISRQAYSYWENGDREIGIENLKLLSQILEFEIRIVDGELSIIEKNSDIQQKRILRDLIEVLANNYRNKYEFILCDEIELYRLNDDILGRKDITVQQMSQEDLKKATDSYAEASYNGIYINEMDVEKGIKYTNNNEDVVGLYLYIDENRELKLGIQTYTNTFVSTEDGLYEMISKTAYIIDPLIGDERIGSEHLSPLSLRLEAGASKS